MSAQSEINTTVSDQRDGDQEIFGSYAGNGFAMPAVIVGARKTA